jgi:hypothetical protein
MQTVKLAPKPMAEMSDREVAEETLSYMRAIADALTEMSNSPMFRTLIPTLGF